jgi:hypothetical protein
MKKNILLVIVILIVSTNEAYSQFWRKKHTKTNKTEQSISRPSTPAQGNFDVDTEGQQVRKPVVGEKENSLTRDRDRHISGQTQQTISLEQLAEVTRPFVQQKPNGIVNWTEQYIEAKGISVIDYERFQNPAQARVMANRGAIVVAQRNLLEIIQGVHVTSETTVQDMIAKSDFIYTRIDGVIKGAIQVGEAIEKDGVIEVTMRVPIYEQNGLASVLHTDAMIDIERFGTRRSGLTQHEKSGILPEGLVFNYNGKQYDPAMFPVIMDSNGTILLDLSKFYNPKEGTFPKILQSTKDIFTELQFDKGTEIINVLESYNGKIVIDKESTNKINWDKLQNVATTASKVLKFVLTLI